MLHDRSPSWHWDSSRIQLHQGEVCGGLRDTLGFPPTSPKFSHFWPSPSRPSHHTVDASEQQMVSPVLCTTSLLTVLTDSNLPPFVQAIARECRLTWPRTASGFLFTSSESECTCVGQQSSQRATLHNTAQHVAFYSSASNLLAVLAQYDGGETSLTLAVHRAASERLLQVEDESRRAVSPWDHVSHPTFINQLTTLRAGS